MITETDEAESVACNNVLALSHEIHGNDTAGTLIEAIKVTGHDDTLTSVPGARRNILRQVKGCRLIVEFKSSTWKYIRDK